MGQVIRRACREDWPSVIRLYRRAAKHEWQGIAPSEWLDIASAEHSFRGELWLACEGERLLGFVAWTDNEIAWLYVDPGSFRQGVGRELLRHALGLCGAIAHISVLAGNAPMLKLCVTEGFSVVEQEDGPIPTRRLRRIAPVLTFADLAS